MIEKLKLRVTRGPRPAVGEIDDVALPFAFDCRVRIVNKALQSFV